jgi:hypothetical protein
MMTSALIQAQQVSQGINMANLLHIINSKAIPDGIFLIPQLTA